MCTLRLAAAVLAACVLVSSAAADDQDDCERAIAFLRAGIAKGLVPKPFIDELTEGLRQAEQARDDGDFGECVLIVTTAMQSLD